MAYYHVVIEARESVAIDDPAQEITLFNITDLQSIIPHIIRPYLNKTALLVEGERIAYELVDLLLIKQTIFPIEQLIEEEQRELPSNTDITISAFEIFHDRELCQDVTQVVLDLLDA